jgi:hypothetical protein
VLVTVTEGRVAPEREDDLRSAWEETASAPAGLIQSTLVRGEDGTWRIITFWESRDAVMAMRASGEPPALTMFTELDHNHRCRWGPSNAKPGSDDVSSGPSVSQPPAACRPARPEGSGPPRSGGLLPGGKTALWLEVHAEV